MIVRKKSGSLKLKKNGIKEGIVTVFGKENNKKLYRIQAGDYRESLSEAGFEALIKEDGVQVIEDEKKEGKKRGRPAITENQTQNNEQKEDARVEEQTQIAQ
jgi:tRNA A37 threonylcarbamoyladenosine biosynthesis protein TsaE